MRKVNATAALVLALSGLLTAPADALAAAPVNYMHIVQKHHTLGDLDIYASPSVSVLQLKKTSCEIFYDAKDKTVLITSKERKLFLKQPAAKFDHRFGRTLSAASDLDVNPKHWKFVGFTQILGQKGNVFSTLSEIATYKKSSNSFLQNRDGTMTVATKLVTLKSPYLLDEFCQLVTKMQEAPDVGGLPISMETYFSHIKNSINTTKISVEKIAPKVPPSLAGYKLAKSSEEIFFGNYDLLNDMLNR